MKALLFTFAALERVAESLWWINNDYNASPNTAVTSAGGAYKNWIDFLLELRTPLSIQRCELLHYFFLTSIKIEAIELCTELERRSELDLTWLLLFQFQVLNFRTTILQKGWQLVLKDWLSSRKVRLLSWEELKLWLLQFVAKLAFWL